MKPIIKDIWTKFDLLCTRYELKIFIFIDLYVSYKKILKNINNEVISVEENKQ
jgi:hypothetical protein